MKKTFLPILLSALLCAALGGCGQGQDGTSSADSSVTGQSSSADSSVTRQSSSLNLPRASGLTQAAGDLSADALSSAASAMEPVLNSWSTLSVPTDLQLFGDTWFLVDCYHNQVLYSEDLSAPLTEWYVLSEDLTYPHTVSSDGTVILVTDTDADRVVVFQESDGVYVETQIFEEIGSRPHAGVYREEDETFYVWSSMTGEMYLFRRDESDNRMYLTEVRTVEELAGRYIRSFTIDGDSVWFVSGVMSDGSAEPGAILRCRLSDLEVEETYPVPDEIAGMACMQRIDGDWYITVSTDLSGSQDAATILRTDDLAGLADGEWEDLYETYFAGGGTPYSITSAEGDWFLTEHRLTDHALWRFQVEDGEITDVMSLF